VITAGVTPRLLPGHHATPASITPPRCPPRGRPALAPDSLIGTRGWARLLPQPPAPADADQTRQSFGPYRAAMSGESSQRL